MNTAGRAAIHGRALAVLLTIFFVGLACNVSPQQAPTAKPDLPQAGQDGGVGSSNARDLSQDESAGGHTLRKHVGRTDDQLRERLRHERNISAASTWTDRDTAEHALGVALEQNRSKIERWLNREGGHPNLVIDYDGDRSHAVGRSLRRGADQPEPCAHATIVLRWAPPNDYYVLTSYPECR
jgi:Bacterial CdiA-CT RNAse A domain